LVKGKGGLVTSLGLEALSLFPGEQVVLSGRALIQRGLCISDGIFTLTNQRLIHRAVHVRALRILRVCPVETEIAVSEIARVRDGSWYHRILPLGLFAIVIETKSGRHFPISARNVRQLKLDIEATAGLVGKNVV
jgi:hypothetical protein